MVAECTLYIKLLSFVCRVMDPVLASAMFVKLYVSSIEYVYKPQTPGVPEATETESVAANV